MSTGGAEVPGSHAAPAAPPSLPNGNDARLDQPPAFSRADLVEDFDRFADILLTRNPLQFADKAQLAQFIRQQRAVLRDGMSELDFYRILTPIVVKVRCGHTGIFLSPAEEARLRSSQRYLPVLVRIAAGRLFVISPLGCEEPQPGSEISSINGLSSAEIIARMYDNITADGANVTRKTYVASRVFNDLYSLFIDDSPGFRVEYRDAGRGVIRRRRPGRDFEGSPGTWGGRCRFPIRSPGAGTRLVVFSKLARSFGCGGAQDQDVPLSGTT